jgi:phage virion morphogenesis protein
MGAEELMGAVVELKLNEIEKLAQKLNSFCLSSDDKKNLLHSLGVEVKEQTLDRFGLEEDPKGDPWKALTEAYKIRKGFLSTGGILEREGYLQTTLTSQVNDENSVTIFSPKPYSGFHQEGTKKMPARPFFGLSTDNIDDLGSMIERFMKKHVE